MVESAVEALAAVARGCADGFRHDEGRTFNRTSSFASHEQCSLKSGMFQGLGRRAAHQALFKSQHGFRASVMRDGSGEASFVLPGCIARADVRVCGCEGIVPLLRGVLVCWATLLFVYRFTGHSPGRSSKKTSAHRFVEVMGSLRASTVT